MNAPLARNALLTCLWACSAALLLAAACTSAARAPISATSEAAETTADGQAGSVQGLLEESPEESGELGVALIDEGAGMSTSENFQPNESELPKQGEIESGIEGVTVVEITSAEHVRYDVEYLASPPAGGPHLPIWQNCGFYEVPLLDELAVHSLEHGAVWVTYRPSEASVGELEDLAEMAAGHTHMLVSPYSEQGTPFVLSAWGRQLPLEETGDERFGRFLDFYMKNGPTAPEPGAACHSGMGVPPGEPMRQPGG